MTPERQALAAAIEAVKQAEKHLAATASAASDSWQLAGPARDRIAAAELAIEEARRFVSADIVARQLGESVPERPARAKLQSDLAAAQGDLQAAIDARADLEQRRGQAEKAVSWCKSDLFTALKAVLDSAPEVSGLVDEIKALEEQLIDRYEALETLNHHGPAHRVKHEARLDPRFGWDVLSRRPRGKLAGSWAAAFERLQTDAAAPLPGGDAPESKASKRLFQKAG
jgi:hypothetical protein